MNDESKQLHPPPTRDVLMPRGEYIRRRLTSHFDLKRQIARHVALKYVCDFDAVLVDTGSTAEIVAEELFAHRRFLSVLTNNMGVYSAFTRAPASETTTDVAGKNELLMTGGHFADIYESLLGDVAIQAIQSFTPNVTIMGVSGILFERGAFCHGSEETSVKRLMWTMPTDTRILAADWTKFGKRDAHVFGALDLFKLNAHRAIVVTCDPPRDASSEALESFETQIELLKNAEIQVDRVADNG